MGDISIDQTPLSCAGHVVLSPESINERYCGHYLIWHCDPMKRVRTNNRFNRLIRLSRN